MRRLGFFSALLLIVASFAFGAPAYAGSICNDNTWTASEGRGTCSGHGGIAQKGVDKPAGSTQIGSGSSSANSSGSAGTAPAPVVTQAPQTTTVNPPASAASNLMLPNSSTPGAIDPRVTQANIHSTICVSGYTKTVRPPSSYTTALKRAQLMGAYSYFTDKSTSSYEEDHLISLELGGSPTDVKNLWPEPYASTQGARVKDRLENKLHDLVCAGAIPLATAQQAIAGNWWDAYAKYVG